MKNNYYLLQVEGGVEPTVHGPYRTKHERDNAAKQIRQRQKRMTVYSGPILMKQEH